MGWGEGLPDADKAWDVGDVILRQEVQHLGGGQQRGVVLLQVPYPLVELVTQMTRGNLPKPPHSLHGVPYPCAVGLSNTKYMIA